MQPSTPIDWNAILGQIVAAALPYVILLVVTLFSGLSVLGGIALNRLRARLAASEALDKDALGKSIAKQAVFVAEEKSAQRVSEGGMALTGAQKLVVAATFAKDKLPEKPSAEVVADIHAALGATVGLGASGGAGEVAKVALLVLCLALTGCSGLGILQNPATNTAQQEAIMAQQNARGCVYFKANAQPWANVTTLLVGTWGQNPPTYAECWQGLPAGMP